MIIRSLFCADILLNLSLTQEHKGILTVCHCGGVIISSYKQFFILDDNAVDSAAGGGAGIDGDDALGIIRT